MASKRPCLPHHLLAYGISLPERILRAVAAAVGILLWLVTGLIPRRWRKGRFYRLAVERQIKMLADDVGQARLYPGADALEGKTATRMAVGGAVDNALMVAFHASPVWVLLAASDLTAGARAFTDELAQELRDAGVIEEGSPLEGVDAVLGGLGRLSDSLADTLDMPPLDVAAMKETVARVGKDLGDVSQVSLEATRDVDALAKDLLEIARQEDRPLLDITSGVAVDVARTTGRTVVGGLASVGAAAKVATRMVWRDVIQDFGKSADRIRRLGLTGSLRRAFRPGWRSLGRLFHWRFLSLTELALSFGRWRKAPWRLLQA